MVSSSPIFADATQLEADLVLLENLRSARKEFLEKVTNASRSQDESILSVLRLDSAYNFAEFLYLLRARAITSEDDIRVLADMHNQYIVDLMKDPTKMERLGLTSNRLLDAMFTSDTMPRLLQHWRERPGSFDQSNLARFLVTIMSSETCRKLAVAGEKGGFLERERTPFGTIVLVSTGTLETIFGECLRNLRHRILEQGRVR